MAERETTPPPAPDAPDGIPLGSAAEADVPPEVPAQEAPVAEGPGEGGADGRKIVGADILKALGMKVPKDPVKAVRKLATALIESRKERDQAAAERDEARDEQLRAVAEFANSRKRLQREKEERVDQASERLAGEMLPALDAMDAALAIAVQTPAEQRMREGLEAVRHLLLAALGREGLILIDAAPGTTFDPAVHEAALMAEGSGEGSGEMVVHAELRRGYRFRSGKVIRISLVSVGFTEPEKTDAAPGAPVDGERTGEAPEETAPVDGDREGEPAGSGEGSEAKAES